MTPEYLLAQLLGAVPAEVSADDIQIGIGRARIGFRMDGTWWMIDVSAWDGYTG